MTGTSGEIYAPNALLSLTNGAGVNLSLAANRLSLTGVATGNSPPVSSNSANALLAAPAAKRIASVRLAPLRVAGTVFAGEAGDILRAENQINSSLALQPSVVMAARQNRTWSSGVGQNRGPHDSESFGIIHDVLVDRISQPSALNHSSGAHSSVNQKGESVWEENSFLQKVLYDEGDQIPFTSLGNISLAAASIPKASRQLSSGN